MKNNNSRCSIAVVGRDCLQRLSSVEICGKPALEQCFDFGNKFALGCCADMFVDHLTVFDEEHGGHIADAEA